MFTNLQAESLTLSAVHSFECRARVCEIFCCLPRRALSGLGGSLPQSDCSLPAVCFDDRTHYFQELYVITSCLFFISILSCYLYCLHQRLIGSLNLHFRKMELYLIRCTHIFILGNEVALVSSQISLSNYLHYSEII